MLFTNQAAAALYGSTVEEMLQTAFLEARSSTDGLLVQTGDFTRPQEVDFVDAEGATHRLVVSRNLIGDTDFDLTLALDITEVHRLQMQLHFAQRLETVGTLAGGIAHDFNTLLTPILGYSTLLEAMDMPDEVRTRLGHITNAALKARNVVHQILTFSRQRLPSRRQVSMPALIHDVVSLMRATIPAHVLFHVAIRDQTMIDADPGQLEQVLVNLINNAAQAIGNRPGDIHIDTWVETNEAGLIQAAVRVADSGQGMSGEVMSHIFETFFTTKGVGEGSGLGLAVVHGIIQNHDGHIEVESSPGKGTTFTLLLPAASALPLAAIVETDSTPA